MRRQPVCLATVGMLCFSLGLEPDWQCLADRHPARSDKRGIHQFACSRVSRYRSLTGQIYKFDDAQKGENQTCVHFTSCPRDHLEQFHHRLWIGSPSVIPHTDDISTAYISFGGLLLALRGSYRHLANIVVGENVYLLMRK